MRTQTRIAGAAIVAALVLAGCARLGFGFSKIGDLLAAPQNYAGKEVLIRGAVGNTVKLPFLTLRFYTVRDGTGEIRVRTDKELPPPGSEVHVRGLLDSVAVVGDQNIGVHLRELERW